MASMIGPLLPPNSYASSAALFATRQVEAALKDAIVANAMNTSTCEAAYVTDLTKGDAMPNIA